MCAVTVMFFFVFVFHGDARPLPLSPCYKLHGPCVLVSTSASESGCTLCMHDHVPTRVPVSTRAWALASARSAGASSNMWAVRFNHPNNTWVPPRIASLRARSTGAQLYSMHDERAQCPRHNPAGKWDWAPAVRHGGGMVAASTATETIALLVKPWCIYACRCRGRRRQSCC